MLYCRLLIFFFFFFFFFKSFTHAISISNDFDPDQARHFCRAKSGSKLLQRLSADDKSSLADKELWSIFSMRYLLHSAVRYYMVK